MENKSQNQTENTKQSKYSSCFVNPQAVGVDYGNKVRIDVSLIGIDKEDIEIKVEHSYLIIETAPTRIETEGKSLIEEIKALQYYKKFKLSDRLNIETLDATLENGILSITIDYKEETQARKITIH